MHLAALRVVVIAALLAAATALPARAVTLIRDAEIERALRELARPILQAAGLPANNIRIIVVNDRSMNAFVIDGRAIFIHSGLILRLDSADQLQSVIAHEAAHIANGHITRRLANLRNSQSAVLLGMALATVAAATGSPEAAAGIAAGSAGSAQRVFFSHTRAEEAAADNSSVRYMLSAGVDPKAGIEVLEIFRGQEALSVGRQDPYVRTHPLTRDRVRAMQGLVAANPPRRDQGDNADYWFARAHGKLSAFTTSPARTLRDTRGATDAISVMRQAVAFHRRPDPARAIERIGALAAAAPSDPYIQELQGQILLENRRAAPAVRAYARAVDLAPNEPLILGGYGRALLAVNTSDSNARAVRALERARDRDGQSSAILRDLGQAYARTGQPGLASLATAERYALQGRLDDAVLHATRAADRLPRGSAPWQRAQDVLSATQ